MAVTAKDYAKEQLGSLDLGYLNNERNVANDIYNTSKQGLDTNYNNLIEQINKNRQDTRKNFNLGRGTVAENAFTQNRLNNLDVGSRVAGRSGLKEIGEVGNRMETGRQYSNLANTFYNTMGNLDTNQKQSESQYNLDSQGLKNTLNQTLAGIDSRGAEASNNYNMSLAQLAEQVQGRWDNNANAQAALAQARAAAAQANANAQAAARQQLESMKRQDLTAILNNKDLNADQMISRITSQFKVNPDLATKVLQEAGILSTGSFGFSAKKPYTPSNYYQQIVRGEN